MPGLVAVASEKEWGHINRAGVVVIPPSFSMAHPFNGRRARVVAGGRLRVRG